MELVIQSLEDKEILGKVSQNRAGNFVVEAKDKVVEKNITDMVERVASANPILPLRSGREIREKGKIRHETIEKQCRRGEPDYLYALAEHITQKEFRRQNKIAGREVRAFVQG